MSSTSSVRKEAVHATLSEAKHRDTGFASRAAKRVFNGCKWGMQPVYKGGVHVSIAPQAMHIKGSQASQTRNKSLVRPGTRAWSDPEQEPGQTRNKSLVRPGTRAWSDPEQEQEQLPLML
jgi:hypothetical protein